MITAVTFYSFKGGLGRSAALANVAAFMALEKGHTVVALDMDLDAPGLGMWLPPARSRDRELGLLDLIDEALRLGCIPENLSPYLYEAELPAGRGPGRIYVLGAGSVESDYPRRVSDLNWQSFFEGLDAPGFFNELKKRLEDIYGVNRILVDARTGFSDPAAVAVRSLASLAVLLFRPDDQNLRGLEIVLDNIREDQKRKRFPACLLVASPLPVCRPNSEEERAQELSLLDAIQRLRVVTVGESEDQVDDPNDLDQLTQSILRIRWQEALALTTRPVIRTGRVDEILALDYRKLGEAVERWISDNADTSRPLPWGNAGRRAILDKALGDINGREDPRLYDAFIRTDKVDQALDSQYAFVFASKGAGKTAIFRRLSEQSSRPDSSMETIPVHGDVGDMTVLAPEDLPQDGNGEETFERFWLSYMAARLRSYADQGSRGRGQSLSDLRRQVGAESNAPRERFDEAARYALQRAGARDIRLLIDATERLFGDRPLDQAASFRGLSRAWLLFRASFPRIHLKAFIRREALLDQSGTLIDRSHVQARSVDLDWEEPDAWWFLLRRFLNGTRPEDLPASIDRGLLQALEENDRPDQGQLENAREALETIFPRQVYPGENEARFHRWLLARIRDGNYALYPRALLAFARKCQELEKKNDRQPPASVFDANNVRQAFIDASKEHAEAVLGELSYLKPYWEVIAHSPFSSTQVRYEEAELRREFGKVYEERKERSPAPEVALNTLVTLGILRHSPGRTWSGEPYDYDVPPLYRFKLVPSPRGRV